MTAVPLPLPTEPLLDVSTLRFGTIQVPAEAVIHFADGLPGFDGLHHFILLAVRPDLAWLQSTEHPALAFLLVRPWRVVAGIGLDDPSAWAVVTIGVPPASATANLMAPLRIDLARQSGRQEILTDTRWGTAEPFDLEMI